MIKGCGHEVHAICRRMKDSMIRSMMASGAGTIFGATGGVMEAALCTDRGRRLIEGGSSKKIEFQG